jgi:hypothetical protein
LTKFFALKEDGKRCTEADELFDEDGSRAAGAIDVDEDIGGGGLWVVVEVEVDVDVDMDVGDLAEEENARAGDVVVVTVEKVYVRGPDLGGAVIGCA